MDKTDITQVAEIELVYRTKVRANERPKVSSSKQSYAVFMQYWNMDKIELVEQFKIMLLNKGHGVLGIVNIATGGIDGVTVDARLIFAAAIKAGACKLILAHNHPSGSLKPSEADIELSCEIKVVGSLLNIKVLDHLLITKDAYCSFADHGYI